MPAFNLPALPQRKIVNYFKELEIQMTEQNLIRPTSQFVTRFYMEILNIYVNRNYFSQTENPNAMLNFIKEVSDFVSTVGLKNLSFKEIFNPNERTFTQICSYIANFSMFRDSKKDLYDRASEIAEGSMNIKNELQGNKSRMLREIEAFKKQKEENDERVDGIREEIGELEKEYKGLKQEQKDRLSEIGLLKKEKIDLSDKICTLEMIEHNLAQDVSKLNMQIVSNPEELLGLVQEMRLLLDAEKKKHKEVHKDRTGMTNKLTKSIKALEKVKKIHSIAMKLQKIEEDTDRVEQNEFVINSQIKSHESSIKNKEIRKNHTVRQTKHLQTKIDGLGAKSSKFNEEIRQKLEAIKEEHRLLSDQKEEKENIKRRNNAEIQKYMLKKSVLEGEYTKECCDLLDLLNEIKIAVEINKLN
ncbi:NUF2 [Enterospora canceri]|uniref:NUF2 n=1 Tax=Enterospora canceri TaxID=1081671 RepID=A0A1Y1S8G3_9MICR|nr:NUF2 [Enterospora canceri]